MHRFHPALRGLALALAIYIASPAQAQSKDTLHLTVQAAVAQALTSSDEVRISQAQVSLAEAQVVAARATGFPQARLTSTYTHAYENARAQAVGSVFNQPNTYNTSVNFSQSIFQGGRIVAARRVAEDARGAARFDEREVRARVSVDAQRAYLQALYTRQVAALQDTNLALVSARLAQIEQLERAGRAARYDVLRARVDRANIEPLLIQARSDRDIALLELKRQLNIPLAQPLVLTSTIDGTSLRGLVATLVDTSASPDRPTLRSAELTLRAREEAVTIARADYFPSLALSLQSGFQAFPPPGSSQRWNRLGIPAGLGSVETQFCADPAATRGCQNGGWFSDRTLLATVTWPLFDGLRTHGNIQVARAQAQIAELQLRQQREVVALDVARTRSELARSLAVFEARRQNAAEAAEAFQLASLRFSTGLSTQLEVSDAQLSMLNAQSGAIRSVYDLYLAATDLARALGQPVPTPPVLPGSGAEE